MLGLVNEKKENDPESLREPCGSPMTRFSYLCVGLDCGSYGEVSAFCILPRVLVLVYDVIFLHWS